ncbi:glucose 1-dehydrogenase [Sphingomonas oligophenolica]|uniref:SDR family oxidoreductase n=1 Tax=Sphingomonas oligophenolica TaxID=301154 RepID=A0ABU9Y0H5_9SPHN
MSQPPLSAFSLAGKVAFVTGGAGGIGVGIVTMLAEAGAAVIIADREEAAARALAASLNAAGHIATAIAVDLADEASIVAACAEAIARFGTPWILVNNAGIQDRALLLEASAAEWDRMNAVNARGPFLLTRELGKAMVEKGEGGRIVNIATAGLRGSVVKGLAAYVGSKGSLLALSGISAYELAEHGITVNTVMPGAVATPGARNAKGPAPDGPARRALPLGPICEPADIAAAVTFFASPAARYVTNQVIAVDAGFSVT